MRRTLIIVGAIVVILGIGFAIYFFFFRPSVTTTPGGTLPVAGPGSGTGTGTGSDGTPSNTPITVAPRLVQISKGPVVPGEIVLNVKAVDASSTPETSVQYIERQSGNIFSYSVRAKTLTRISNKTIPGIQSASWLPTGAIAYVQYLSGDNSSTINTYALSATGTDGFFLPQDLSAVAASPSSASPSILTLASGVNGSVASLLNTNGTQAVPVFTSPLSMLRVAYAGKQFLAYTKPSGGLRGNAYLVDTFGNFSRVAGPEYGLSALPSPSGGWVLASFVQNNVMKTVLVNTATNETLPLPLSTLAEKCVWAADDSVIYCGVPVDPPLGATYPDDWYQGAVRFSDRLWKIQVIGRYAQLVLDFSQEAKSPLDAVALAIDPNTTTLVFVNKNDGSLWSYSL